MRAARMPRNRVPILPRWTAMPPAVRITVGVIVGALAVIVFGAIA